LAEVVVLEIRGVGGATAGEILGGDVTQTAGDELAGFYRPDEPQTTPTEAYEWGKLTSGSRTSALWWILFPFTLINVAGWMFRPTATELGRSDEPRRSSLWFSRLVIVGGGLAVTAAYITWITALTTEMLAFGCSTDEMCAARWYMAPLTFFGEDNSVWLITGGIGLAALLVLGLFLFILRTQDRLEGYEISPTRRLLGAMQNRMSSRLRRNTQLEDPAFWYKWSEHRRLFRWHLGLTMVLLGGAAGHAIAVVGWSTPQKNAWPAIVAILVVILMMLWALTAPERFRDSDTLDGSTTNSGDRVVWLLTHVSLATAGFAGGAILTNWLRSDPTTGFGFLAAVRVLSFILYLAAGVMVILLAIRKRERDAPTTWPRVLMPAFAAALAVIITGAGFAAVANLLGRFLLGAEWVSDHGFNIVIVDIFLLSLIVTGGILLFDFLRTEQPAAAVASDYFGTAPYGSLSDREQSWVKSVARARSIAALPSDADVSLAVLTVVMLILNLGQAAAGGFDIAAGPDGAFASPLFGIDGLSFLHTLAATGIVLYLFPGLRLIRTMSKSRDSRRQLGKVWDVLSFWPRRFHPLAAPCYAERAVPEFRNRIRDHLAGGRGVVVSAHSQGTVIAFAALAQLAAEGETLDVAIEELVPGPAAAPEPEGALTFNQLDAMVQRSLQPAGPETTSQPTPPIEVSLDMVGLVTFGSPLSTLYGSYFPWHFGTPGRFQGIRDKLATVGGGRAWHSLWRPTDYIGQEVFTPPGGVLEPAVPGADVMVNEAAGPLFGYQSHSNYEREQQVRAVITETVTGIADL
jgi:hypothetical protein